MKEGWERWSVSQVSQYWVPKAILMGILQTIEHHLNLAIRHSEYYLVILGSTKDPIPTARQDELALTTESCAGYDVATIPRSSGNGRYALTGTPDHRLH